MGIPQSFINPLKFHLYALNNLTSFNLQLLKPVPLANCGIATAEHDNQCRICTVHTQTVPGY